MRVGFIGLGSQGGPMARAIVDAGFSTTVWARRAASLEPYADTAATVAATPAELAAHSDIVCLCVTGDDDVRGIAGGAEGVLAGMQPGGVIVIHSTVHPKTCHDLSELAAAQGVSVVDAPVSGGGPAVAAKQLLVMVGGEDADVQRCLPVFHTYGDPVVHLGPLGAGQITKILNNLLFSANLGSALKLLELGETLGVPRTKICEVLTHGSAHSKALETIAALGGTLEHLAPIAGPLLRKDVGLAGNLADSVSVVQTAVFDAADAALDSMDCSR